MSFHQSESKMLIFLSTTHRHSFLCLFSSSCFKGQKNNIQTLHVSTATTLQRHSLKCRSPIKQMYPHPHRWHDNKVHCSILRAITESFQIKEPMKHPRTCGDSALLDDITGPQLRARSLTRIIATKREKNAASLAHNSNVNSPKCLLTPSQEG